MNLCKSYKTKFDNTQCPNKIKHGLFCGKHKKNTIPVFNICPQNLCINNLNLNIQPDMNPVIESDIQPDVNPVIVSDIQPVINNLETEANKIKQNNIKYNLYKMLEHTNIYTNYLQQRTNYIKEPTKHIELIEYIENNKLDYYPTTRILMSLEYYKLITIQSSESKFMLVINNVNKLITFFNTLININININKLIKLQRWIKYKLVKYKISLRGPAFNNRKLCVNDTDFASLDDIQNIEEIPDNKFFSFKDNANYIYGFNIDSIIDLIMKSDQQYYENINKHLQNLCYKQVIKTLSKHYNKININNPYTQCLINYDIKYKIFTLYAQEYFKSIVMNINNSQNIKIKKMTQQDIKTAIRHKCFAIFQKINIQGYFTDISWLLDEIPSKLKIFYGKLSHIWNIEFGLDDTARYNISKTHNLFNNMHEILRPRTDKYVILDKILNTINILISNGDTDGDKNTGCILVLYSLAHINTLCIQSNPWLS